jgi:flagellar basal-body rod protein FlgB
MNWSTVSPIGPIKQRLEWLGQRQQVLAGNIANADTPGYVPRDLRPLAFADVVRRETQVRLTATDARHLAERRKTLVNSRSPNKGTR